MKARKNPFIKFRNWLEHNVSNLAKEWTGNDLFDWINLLILFGAGSAFLLYLFMNHYIKQLETFLQAWILWFTAFVLLRYTKETYWLKKLAQKQIEVEQEPYVVCEGTIKLANGGRHEITLKNVGRGSALRITCSQNKSNRDEAFFEDSRPHAYYLSMNEEVNSLIEAGVVNQLRNAYDQEGYIYFFIFYKSQLGKIYVTKVKMKLRPDEFVIMENQRFKNKAERENAWME